VTEACIYGKACIIDVYIEFHQNLSED